MDCQDYKVLEDHQVVGDQRENLVVWDFLELASREKQVNLVPKDLRV